MKASLPPIVAVRLLCCATLLILVLAAALLRRPANTRPLPAADTVLLLLAPGSSLSDWTDSTKAPNLARLMESCPHGVIPTRTDETPATAEEPLTSAARMIATGDRMPPHLPPTLAQVLRRSQIQMATLANEDSAARTVLGLARPDPLTIDLPKWRAVDAGFPDGLVTDPAAFAAAFAAAMWKATQQAPPASIPSLPAAAEPQSALMTVPPGIAPPQVAPSETAKKRLVVATFDDLYRADQYAALALPASTSAQRAQALARLDRLIGTLTSPDSGSRLSGSLSLIVVSPTASSESLGRNERLAPILFWSASEAPPPNGLLTSPSTRATPGLLAGTDIAATIAAAFGLPASRQHIGEGRAARITADDGRLPARICGWDAQEGQQKLLIYIPWILAAILVAATWAAQRGLRIGSLTGAAVALYPAALLLTAGVLPTNWPPIAVYLLAALLCGATALSIGLTSADRTRLRHLLGVVGIATVLTLACDILTGGALLARTPLSYSPMEAARFYGVGNEAAGAMIGAALVAAAIFLEDLTTGGIAFVLFAIGVCLTIALPQLGAKAGSLIGALVGFGSMYVLKLSATKHRRPSLATIVGILASIVVLIAACALFEATRGAEARTHVGEAMAAAHRHGVGALTGIARRKLSMDLHLMVTSPWAALLAVETVLCAYLWRRRARRWPLGDRASLIALLMASAALLVFNDAGVVGAANCLLFAVPFALLPKTANRPPEKHSDESDEIIAT